MVTMCYGHKDRGHRDGYNDRGGESFPLGAAVVEFENKEGLEKAYK